MKLLATGDWHGDHVTNGVRRFAEVRDAAHATVDAAIEEEVAAYAFLGDLCNPDSGAAVFRCVELALEIEQRLRARGIPSFWVAGNHDVVEDGSGDTTLSPLRALSAFGVLRVFEIPGSERLAVKPDPGKAAGADRFVTFVGLPFVAVTNPWLEGQKYDPAAAAKELTNDGRPDDVVVLGHMTEIPEAKPGEETTEMPRGRGIPFPVEACKAKTLCNGHFHRRQRSSGIWMPGALARLTFGEERHDPGFLIVEV